MRACRIERTDCLRLRVAIIVRPANQRGKRHGLIAHRIVSARRAIIAKNVERLVEGRLELLVRHSIGPRKTASLPFFDRSFQRFWVDLVSLGVSLPVVLAGVNLVVLFEVVDRLTKYGFSLMAPSFRPTHARLRWFMKAAVLLLVELPTLRLISRE